MTSVIEKKKKPALWKREVSLEKQPSWENYTGIIDDDNNDDADGKEQVLGSLQFLSAEALTHIQEKRVKWEEVRLDYCFP